MLTFGGYVVPIAAAVVAIPITARALGPVRFGLLGLAWALLEYLGFVELGLGRTSVRFVAQALARSRTELRQIVAVAVTSQGLLAVAGAALLVSLAPTLAHRVFDLPPESRGEAIAMFYAVAANLVVVLLIGAMRGVLEGAERFGVSTAVKIPTATAAVVIPAIAAAAGASLAAIMWWVLLARAAAMIVLFLALPRLLEDFRWELPREWRRLRSLFSYSGWVAVSGFINPILASFDRFALGALAGVAAVGLYTAPYEGAVRLLLIPTSIFAALFPALSAAFAQRGAEARSERLVETSTRQMALVLTPVIVVLFAFAPEVLRAWLGAYFAAEMATAFRILLLGVLANGLAHVPSVYLYAIGRPDLPAKIHIAELLMHVPLTVVLVNAFGVVGAAVAWSIRIILDAVLLSALAAKHGAARAWPDRAGQWAWAAGSIAAITVAAGAARLLVQHAWGVAAALVVVGLLVAGATAWRTALSADERNAWLQLLRGLHRSAQRSS